MRNFNTCQTKVKSALYNCKSLMRPILEYVCTVWALHYHNDIQCIEVIQRRAARFAMNCYGKCQACYTNSTGLLLMIEETSLS